MIEKSGRSRRYNPNHLVLLTDAGNAVYEALNEGNNASGPRTISITRTTPDLLVTTVIVTNSALSEDEITLEWSVRNIGAAGPNSLRGTLSMTEQKKIVVYSGAG